MAANRAFVAVAGTIENGNLVDFQYTIVDSDNNPVLPATGHGGTLGGVAVVFSYSDNNVPATIIAAVQSAESDPSLQVELIP